MTESGFKSKVTVLTSEDDDDHADFINEHLRYEASMNWQIRFKD